MQKLIANHAEYNLWANQQLVNWLADKTVEQLNQEVPSSFSSILKTLNHIWAIDAYWYSIIFQKTDIENRYGVTDLKKEEVLNGLINRSNILSTDAKLLTESDLTEKIKVESPWLNADLQRFEYVLQLVNHGTYHRGQIVTIAHNIGITDIPNTDYVFFAALKNTKE